MKKRQSKTARGNRARAKSPIVIEGQDIVFQGKEGMKLYRRLQIISETNGVTMQETLHQILKREAALVKKGFTR